MIARIKQAAGVTPVFDLPELKTESDVEQKLLYPFLCHPSYIGIPSEWVRTKSYMEPTQIDKGAGKRAGYIPDYSIQKSGFPLLIIEAKSPDETIQKALREAQMYASEINKRYPPNINPIKYVLASNGEQIALSEWDSETQVLVVDAKEAQPGSSVLAAFKSAIGKEEIERRADKISREFQTRRFQRVSAHMTPAQLSEQLGINPFAQQLFPIITKDFGAEADEATDDIIDRGYVNTAERSEYGAVLETYLKDRARVVATAHLQPIETSNKGASGIETELRRYRQNPKFFGRVQLIVGAVGSGKSIFIRRFYRRMLPDDIAEHTYWAFINFNVLPPQKNLRDLIAERFIQSFEETNGINVHDLEMAEKLFSPEMKQFERGAAKQLLPHSEQQWHHQRYLHMKALTDDKEKCVQAISRHFAGEKKKGIVIVFDNVDKRSRDLQLDIFEAAQWIKDITRALVIVNLRDTTFEAHKDEKPLDAFINAVNFYIRPPRFAEVIRKRLEIVLDSMKSEGMLSVDQSYTLESGAKIYYSAEKLTAFLTGIYKSLFERKISAVGAAIESLVARNVRVALGMFADIISSPHVPTSQITTAAVTGTPDQIDEDRILRALMRGRYRLFHNRGPYVRNVIGVDLECKRPSNFLYADILEFLIRSRKQKIDFSVEGYASAGAVVSRMGTLGYDEEDAFRSLKQLVQWNLVEPESLALDELQWTDPVQVHASGFIHMRYLLQRPEYLVGISADLAVSSFETSSNIAAVWNQSGGGEPGFNGRKRILQQVHNYMIAEYERRCKRHAFYDDVGYGGKTVVQSLEIGLNRHTGQPQNRRAPVRSRPPRH
jgi:GTPase SAR1 family protein